MVVKVAKVAKFHTGWAKLSLIIEKIEERKILGDLDKTLATLTTLATLVTLQ